MKRNGIIVGASKYMGLVVSIALVIGQVQYAYAAYYCTMVHHQVSIQTDIAAPHVGHVSDQTCLECDCTGIPFSTQQRYEPDCLRLTIGHKDVVGSFQEPSASNLCVSGLAAALPVRTQIPSIALHSTMAVSGLVSSSPGIPALNNNLRI